MARTGSTAGSGSPMRPTRPIRYAWGRVGAGAGLRRRCLRQLAGSRRPGRPDAERRDGRACLGQSRPVPLPHLARKPRLPRGLLRALHGRRRRDRPLCLRWDALRRVRHRVAGRHLERRLAPRCRHVRWPRAAPVPRWPTGRRADGRAAAYRLRPDVRAHRLRPVRRRLRTPLPRRHRPRAAVVRTPVAGGRRQGRRRLLGTARRRTATRRRSGKGDPGRLDDAGLHGRRRGPASCDSCTRPPRRSDAP